MKKGSDVFCTVDEGVAVLKNTSLPTLIVEGRSDMLFYRNIEQLCLDSEIDILPVGSRQTLIKLYERRAEFSASNVAFLADSDLFCVSEYPASLTGIIFTKGYSIENDILSGGKAFRTINKRNKKQWNDLLEELSRWFASLAHRKMIGEQVEYADHPNQVVDFQTIKLRKKAAMSLIQDEQLSSKVKLIRQSPIFFLRGHTLLNALGHFLALKNTEPKCSKDMLLHIDVVAWDSNSTLCELIQKIKVSISDRKA